MAEKDDEADERSQHATGEPGSGRRVKHTPAEYLQLAVASFRGRAEGLTGEELQREVDQLVELIVERNTKMLPRGMRDEMRRVVRQMIETDPAMQALIGDLRNAAERG